MCKKAGLLVGWDDGSRRALVARADCDSWRCAECTHRMAENWGLRASLGAKAILRRNEPLDFVTITSHEKLPDFAATERVWRSAWSKLYAALKRKKSGLDYMIVPEKHKSGRMHVHALWNAGVTKKWLKDNARKRGLGYECEIISIASEGYAQKYVVKYVGKSLGDDCPLHFRRVRVSSHWTTVPQPNTPMNGLRWEYVSTNGALEIIYEECERRNITLIDAVTGEIFDDVDLGTRVVGS